MNLGNMFAISLAATAAGVSLASADTLQTHRIPAALAVEAATEAVDACAKQGYRETAVVVDADGITIAAVRGDGAGSHTLDNAHDKAYTSASFKNDTIAFVERLKTDESFAQETYVAHILFVPGGVVIKLGEETIGAIGAGGAPGGKFDDDCARAGLDKIRDRLK